MDRISELCNLLLELGHFEIYDTPKYRLLPADAVNPEREKKEKVDELLADLDDSDDEEAAAAGAVAPAGPGSAPASAKAASSPKAAAPAVAQAVVPQFTERDGPFFQYVLNGQTYGPFPARQMLGWAVLFKGKGLPVRNCSMGNQPLEDTWRKYDEIDFGLYA